MVKETKPATQETTERKLAIVGWHGGTRDDAPFLDPNWTIWACNELGIHGTLPRDKQQSINAYFQFHKRSELDKINPRKYEESIAWYEENTPEGTWVYLKEAETALENSKVFPFARVQEWAEGFHAGDGSRFASSIAWMMVYGAMSGYTEIAIYGVEMASNDEYAYQKSNMRYWIGVLRGMGIKVTLPAECSIEREPWVYAVEDRPMDEGIISQDYLREKLAMLGPEQQAAAQARQQADLKLAEINGAFRMASEINEKLVISKRELGILT